MKTFQDRLAHLSPEKRDLLLRKLQEASSQAQIHHHSIPAADRTQGLPLSFAQQRLWFLSQFEGGQSAYNMAAAMRLEGTLQTDVFIASFQAIMQRHEALRTRFVMQGGEPVQVIDTAPPLPLRQLDWRHLSATEQDDRLTECLQTETQQPFTLDRGSLFRLVLIQTSATTHLLIATLHHIVTDEWSMNVLVQELMAHYQALMHSQGDSLAALPIQYADYAIWQRQWLNQPDAAQQLAYWKQQLVHAPSLLELPTDRPRPSVQTFRGQTLERTIDPLLTAQLKQLAQQTGTTLFMVLEAAFALLMHRLSRQDDILIGTPIANRRALELEPLIGFFVNTLVLRNDLSGNPTFRELLLRTKQMAVNAYRHQDLPFEQLVEALQPTRTLSHTPLFQVMFGLQNTPRTTLALPDLTLSQLPIPNPTAKFDLTVLMYELPDGLLAAWEYNCDLFDDATIDRFGEHFHTLLQHIVARPVVPIAQLSVLSAEQHQQIVYDWNQTETCFTGALTLHEGVEQQALRTPDAIAITQSDRTITYAELNQRANQLARTLQTLGVQRDVLVGVCGDRCIDVVAALLAVLKAGGAYVPIDPSYPQERIADILADSNAQVLITQRHLAAHLPTAVSILYLEDDLDSASNNSPASLSADPFESAANSERASTLLDSQQAATANLNVSIAPSQLAYVIYTSGSTGRPKGVMISHAAAANTLQDINHRFQIGTNDRVLCLASLSFDLSIYDIFGFLAAGGTLVMPHPAELLNPAHWLDLMHQQQVTFWNTAPAVMELLISYATQQERRLPDSLRLVMMSGDAISLTLPEQIRQQASPEIQIYSFGGATEASIWSIYYPIETIAPEWTSIPYGRPLANQRFHILDADLNPVPIGVPGELHIGGVGVSMGYLNRPDLTQAKFIADPFSADPAARLYKTGDLGRYGVDGTIQFLGRIDHQVKLRGFRIELGEIEATLIQYPGVREAVAIVREDQPGDKRLCGYIVAPSSDTLVIAELRQFLREKLPDYMVPAAIVRLEQLPLTPNGKVDRKALPEPDELRDTQREAIVLPRTQLEQQIAAIWQAQLQVSPIGLHDNFFDLGGHSLLMVKVHSQLQELGLELTIVELFQYPTIAALASHLQTRQHQASATEQAQQRSATRTAHQTTLQQQQTLRRRLRTQGS